MHVVAVVALDGVVGFDLAIACQVFATARLSDGSAAYDVRVCAALGVSATAFGASCFRIDAPWTLDDIQGADTVVVPGHTSLPAVAPPETTKALDMLRRSASRGARIVSICTGAFMLAAAGLLDGRRATTHWQAAAELARRYPLVDVDASVLFVDEGKVITSAGMAAGLDACLHVVQRDYGASVAVSTARYIVMPLRREGGQAQFISHQEPSAGGSALQATLQWMELNLDRASLTLRDIARHANTSVRSLSRHFRAQTGTTPMRWLLAARLRRAQHLLEATDLPIEGIAERAGFGSTVSFRSHFRRLVGTAPQAYRRAFGEATWSHSQFEVSNTERTRAS
jgi:transcriptional regulator GlxA family with amidase domain